MYFSISVCDCYNFSHRLNSLSNLYCNLVAAIDTEWKFGIVYWLTGKGWLEM